MTRVIFLLTLLLPVASPTLLAAVPVAIDTDGLLRKKPSRYLSAYVNADNPKFASVDEAPVNLGESLEADAFLGYLRESGEMRNIGPHLDVGYAYLGEAREPVIPVNIGPEI